jgi:hypothetical protein
MFVGGLADGIALIFILAGLGVVFIVGSLMGLFFRIVGMGTGRAVLWGYGLPLFGSLALIGLSFVVKGDEPAREFPATLPLGIEPETTRVGQDD